MANQKSEDPGVPGNTRPETSEDQPEAVQPGQYGDASGQAGPPSDPDDPDRDAEAARAQDAMLDAEIAEEERLAEARLAEERRAEERLADERLANEGLAEPASDRRLASAGHAEEEVEEEHGRSFAARALTFLLTLLVGAGLGIWAAPRVAPMLPSGLAPVAAWLTPQESQLDARVAAIETRVEGDVAALGARIDALPEPPDAAAIEGRAQALVDTAQADLAGRIDALRTDLTAGPGQEAADARIGALETALAGATAELSALKGQIESGAAGLSAEASQSIDTYRAELEGLRAEVGRLSGSVSGFDTRLGEAMTAAQAQVSAAQAQVEEAQQTAAVQRDLSEARADVALIRAALASGAPFQEPADRLAQEADVTLPASLSDVAATGVATPAELRAQFSDAAHAAIRASIQAGAGEGVVNRSRAFLQAQVASRSLTPRAGLDPDAVLSRVEDALRRDDLQAAIAEAEDLNSEARAAMDGWITAAKRRADAEAGLAELSASVAEMN